VQSAPQRIGCFLLRLCKAQEEGEVTLHLPYDKTLIAARLGMKPETFSRALTRLRQESDIEVKGATVSIPDIQRLVGYTCNACSNAYPCKDL
jgi:CRP-like cAMP-binding protein